MRINSEFCDLCGTCASVCPVDAINIEEYRAWIDAIKCIECGNCRQVCPARAIEEQK